MEKWKINLKEFQSITFFGLKSKMYSTVSEHGEKTNTVKGINISIEFEKYENILFNESIMRPKMKRSQSKLQRIGTFDVCKISLSCFDDKRYILNYGITTIAYLHKDLKT